MFIEAFFPATALLATAPFRGECHDDLLPGLRYLALDRVLSWFRPRSENRDIQILAVLFRGQDHQRRILVRLLQNSSDRCPSSPGSIASDRCCDGVL